MRRERRDDARLRLVAGIAMVAVSGLLVACDGSAAGPEATTGATLLRIAPAGGETGVSTTVTVRVEFDRPMAEGAEEGCRLHVGGIEGPGVEGTWMWSDDHHVLTFTPGQPLAPATEHTLHLGGGLMDAGGHHVDYGEHGAEMGGMHVDGGMMGGGMGGGSMMGDGSHDGTWWEDSDGGFGWMFSFRTGT